MGGASAEAPNLAVRVTPQLRSKLDELLSGNKLSYEEKKSLKEDLKSGNTEDLNYGEDETGKPVEVLHYRSLQLICRHSLFSIKDLTRRELIVSSPPIPLTPFEVDSSPEVVARRAYLRQRQEEREYNQMVHGKGIDPTDPEEVKKAQGNDISALTDHSSVAVQMIVAPLASFVVAYYVVQQSWKADEHTCMVWGLFIAMIMLIIEGILYVARAERNYLKRKQTDTPASRQQRALPQKDAAAKKSD